MSNNFIDELMTSVRDPESKIRVGSLVAKYAGQVIYIRLPSKKSRRIRAAEHMLANQTPPGEVVGILVTRFGVSARTAQYDVEEARKIAKNNCGKR